ncbi:MAG: hypothetical protein A3J38_10560 [Gammaproteobacteria bacterium RIFCSPHIGHO2_12_FULL_45_9]|nr:MAG: hypothetical protein A3J38_10560 [Gammaproteobacteria bacterium RIFCSPHIGHO2_12_FULL_45_9]
MAQWYSHGLWILWISALLTFISLWFIQAPYGRHQRTGWGPSLSGRWGWFWMELPSVALFTGILLTGYPLSLNQCLMGFLWLLHYVHRTFIFPLKLVNPSPMPISIIGMGFTFNVLNSFLNAYWITFLSPLTHLNTPLMVIGMIIFFAGFYINKKSDAVLHALRRHNPKKYIIPQGFLHNYIASPNYLGEILEWIGFACVTQSQPAIGFAAYTIANLVPRAYGHWRWYQRTFPRYPENRRILIPKVW